jgi:hypothetical protein
MARSPRQPQEPTHEDRGQEEEGPHEAGMHVNRRANCVNTSSEPVNSARMKALEKTLRKWCHGQEMILEVSEREVSCLLARVAALGGAAGAVVTTGGRSRQVLHVLGASYPRGWRTDSPRQVLLQV